MSDEKKLYALTDDEAYTVRNCILVGGPMPADENRDRIYRALETPIEQRSWQEYQAAVVYRVGFEAGHGRELSCFDAMKAIAQEWGQEAGNE